MRITERMSAQKNLSIKSAPNRGWPLNYVGMRDSQRTCLENPNSLKPKIKKKNKQRYISCCIPQEEQNQFEYSQVHGVSKSWARLSY